jgi:hypothetical protein
VLQRTPAPRELAQPPAPAASSEQVALAKV